jgi:hypothetical protein
VALLFLIVTRSSKAFTVAAERVCAWVTSRCVQRTAFTTEVANVPGRP